MTSGVEWAGLALSLAKGVEQLSGFLVTSYHDVKNYGIDLETTRLALALEAENFAAIKSILFGRQVGNATSSGVFGDFDTDTQLAIVNVLRRFKESLEYQYQLVNGKYETEAPGFGSMTDPAIPFGSYHSASLFRRLRWSFKDKPRLEKIVQELQGWNERLQRILQVKLIQGDYAAPNASRGRLSTALNKVLGAGLIGSAQSLGLSDDIELARITTAPTAAVEKPSDQPLEIESFAAYENVSAIVQSRTRRLIRVRGQNILLEYKDFEADEAGNPPARSRDKIHQLSKILHHNKPSRYRTLQCQGYYAHNGRFTMLFPIPSDLNPRYTTLGWLLQNSKVPGLEGRFALARKLCAAMAQLHAVHWVHKSFNSENILFFSRGLQPTSAESIENLYLSGWDYSRSETGLSSQCIDTQDIQYNVYRHPQQWGHPTTRFNRTHDMYSLGVILLEIGRWKSALSFHSSKFRHIEIGSAVRSHLISCAKDQKLRSSMGKRYQAIVLKCLEGNLEDNAAILGPVANFYTTSLADSTSITLHNEILETLDEIVCHL
ncbi:hypothetical protein F5Y07DRAFT_95113 [Xylaria sp. FL0933]|nr:hypothetical protein F5Y07DRAFT_95113 [Xylaria sp. FL0933]